MKSRSSQSRSLTEVSYNKYCSIPTMITVHSFSATDKQQNHSVTCIKQCHKASWCHSSHQIVLHAFSAATLCTSACVLAHACIWACLHGVMSSRIAGMHYCMAQVCRCRVQVQQQEYRTMRLLSGICLEHWAAQHATLQDTANS